MKLPGLQRNRTVATPLYENIRPGGVCANALDYKRRVISIEDGLVTWDVPENLASSGQVRSGQTSLHHFKRWIRNDRQTKEAAREASGSTERLVAIQRLLALMATYSEECRRRAQWTIENLRKQL